MFLFLIICLLPLIEDGIILDIQFPFDILFLLYVVTNIWAYINWGALGVLAGTNNCKEKSCCVIGVFKYERK